eukprot:3908172-Rhodomonas_salina.1
MSAMLLKVREGAQKDAEGVQNRMQERKERLLPSRGSQAHPQAARAQDQLGPLPLHWFVGTGGNDSAHHVELLAMLMKASERTSCKCMPTRAFLWMTPTEREQQWDEDSIVHSEAASSSAQHGALALPCLATAAVAAGAPGHTMTEHNVQMLAMLLEGCVHLPRSHGCLLQAFPEAFSTKDVGGNTPVDWFSKGTSATATRHRLTMLAMIVPRQRIEKPETSPQWRSQAKDPLVSSDDDDDDAAYSQTRVPSTARLLGFKVLQVDS